jgi:predicted RecB family nuclease
MSEEMSRPITKTDFVAGCQCSLRLWNRHHNPIPYEDRVETTTMRAGTNVGMLAQQLFPGGVLVDAAPWERDKAVAQTKALIADNRVPAIFEAAFTHSGLHARVDILKRKRSGVFALYEVKSTGEVKDQHLPDLAFQVYVARKSGIKVNEAGIVHINKDYVRGDQLDAAGLFTLSDQTAAIADELKQLPRLIKQQLRVLGGKAPTIAPSGHCHLPYSCEFWDRCTQDKPKDWIFHLPWLSATRYEELCALGIDSIKAIPKTVTLSALQVRVRDVLRSKRPYIATTLRDPLSEVAGPVCYLDFETVAPAVPLWPGTRPFERIPFQWSLHRRDSNGQLHHSEFLADGTIDPRPAFAEALVKALRPHKHPVVVYNKGFEGSVIRALAGQFKDVSRHLSQIEKLLWDLLPVVRDHVYFAKFDGSFSIKSVAPVLSRDVRYDSLDGVAEGGAASDAFIRIVTGELGEGETSDGLRAQLLKYCHLDTLAMVKVHEALDRLALQ